MHPWAIFVEGLKNWRVNWRKLTGIYLLIYIPLTLLDLLWVSKGDKSDLVQLASSLIHWALDSFVMASLILSVQEQLNTIIRKATDTMKAAIKYLWRYMLTVLLYGIIVVGIIMLVVVIMSFMFAAFISMPSINIAILLVAVIAIIACVVAVVYCVIRFSLAGVICVMEEVGPIRSFKTSHSLIKKSIKPVVEVFLLILLTSALLFFPGFRFSLSAGSKTALGTILLVFYQVLVGAVTVPILASVTVVLYKKLKGTVN